MAYGDVVRECWVIFREWAPHCVYMCRRKSVTVEHVGRNRILIHLPLKRQAIRKSLTAKRIEVISRDGRDLVAEWREVPRQWREPKGKKCEVPGRS